MNTKLTGGCACGNVRYTVDGPVKFAMRCYCRACQRDSGSGHLVMAAVPRANLSISGEMARIARTADSGLTVEKAFCPSCGCPLFGFPERAETLVMIMVGNLDSPGEIDPKNTVYGDCAQPWDPPCNSEV